MFRKILLANRGEVAVRVNKTAQRLGIKTVAAVTDVDRKLSYTADVDEVASIGDKRGYLDQEQLIAVAKEHKCSALHPGWGFLSENPSFAAMAEAVGITFIGPRPLSMRQMADKATARSTMRALGLSPIPGVDRSLYTLEAAIEAAAEVGYPLLLKAVAGGGGRGMRIVLKPEELSSAFIEASSEAMSAFGESALYMERLIVGGRHIEFQLLCDGKRAVVLGERECSIQRRHQKLLEESPSPVVSREQSAQLSAVIADVAVELGYRGAGTMEMLRDASGEIFFMEMNTRLQVEHTITEERYGVDLVEEQLKIAAHHPLKLEAIEPVGHSIQCRINAESVVYEDGELDFRPTPGLIERLVWPEQEGIRIDTHLREGDRISPHYDSMIAKVIVHAPTRGEAIELMIDALSKTVVEGVPTTIPFHLAILKDSDFRSGSYNTSFIDEKKKALSSAL